MNRCRSCGAGVRWARTTKGHNHPLNFKPDPAGRWVIVNEVMVLATDEPGDRYTSHFATCPNAKSHRRSP